jgi:hypothetical protein
VLPIAVFALFGSSRHLVVGADSARSWRSLPQERALVMADVGPAVKAQLDAYGLTDKIGSDRFYESILDVVEAYRAATGSATTTSPPSGTVGRPGQRLNLPAADRAQRRRSMNGGRRGPIPPRSPRR